MAASRLSLFIFSLPAALSLNCTLTLDGNTYDLSGFARAGLKAWDPQWSLWNYHAAVCAAGPAPLTPAQLAQNLAAVTAGCPAAPALQR